MTLSASTLAGLGLALGCALAWTLLDAIRKRLARDLSAAAILLGITLPQLPIHLSLAWAAGWRPVTLRFLCLTLVAATLTAGANLLLVRAVHLSPLSLTVPYLSFAPVMTLLAGLVLLGQVPGPWGVLGVLAVAGGAFVLNAPRSGEPRRLLARLLEEPGSRLMLGVAALFALSTAVDRLAILEASEPLYASFLTGMIAAALLAVPSVRTELWRDRGHLRWLLLAGAVAAVALLLQFFAYRFLFVAYVDALKRGGGNLFAVLLGIFLFAEGDGRRRLLGAALMSAGVALVLLDS